MAIAVLTSNETGADSLTDINANFADLDTTKADLASPTFTGTVVLPSTTSIGTVSNTEISYLDGVTSAIQTQINAKGAGTVTSVSVTTSNGVSGSVATSTTTPAISLTLGAITPTTVNGHTFTTGSSTFTGTAGQTYTFPTTTATLARTDAANTFAGVQTMTSPVINTSIELGHATQNTLTASSGVLSIEGVVIPTISSTNTITNKRITKRVVTTTDDATAVIDVDVTDVYQLSAVANATTFTLTGTPTDGQTFIVRYKDAGVAKALTWTGFTAIGVTLPTTTTASKWGYVGVQYNSAASAYHVIAVTTEA